MGKGSRQRPAAITREELDARWAATFKDTDEALQGSSGPVVLAETEGRIIDLMQHLKDSLNRKD
jgi:hypothetical protein